MQRPEEVLVARCRQGDLDAFGQVYAQHERAVFRYAYHLLGNRDDADDVKQETFLKAYRAFSSFRSECSLSTWLLKICGNLCRDRMKSRDRRPEVLYDPVAGPEHLADSTLAVDPVAAVERAQTRETLLAVLRGMPAEQRDILVLRELEDLSYEEIAEIMGCSRASVKVRLFRARSRFRERVESVMRGRR